MVPCNGFVFSAKNTVLCRHWASKKGRNDVLDAPRKDVRRDPQHTETNLKLFELARRRGDPTDGCWCNGEKFLDDVQIKKVTEVVHKAHKGKGKGLHRDAFEEQGTEDKDLVMDVFLGELFLQRTMRMFPEMNARSS